MSWIPPTYSTSEAGMMPSHSRTSPLPSFHSAPSAGRHFYIAVDRLRFKMETLVDLLGVAGRRPSLPIVLCCSSRDELDGVCAAVSNLPFISLSLLYSDLPESERAVALEKFHQSIAWWNQSSNFLDGYDRTSTQKLYMVVVTDACLPLITSGEEPLLARVLINYELPTKKETYLRCISTCLATDGIVINMVVGGEVLVLKGIEESTGLVIAEMPINITEIF